MFTIQNRKIKLKITSNKNTLAAGNTNFADKGGKFKITPLIPRHYNV